MFNLFIPKSPFCISFKDDEYQNLSENMKYVGKGKKILFSNSRLSTEAPTSDFNLASDKKTKRSTRHGRGCKMWVRFLDFVFYKEHNA